MNQLSLVKNKYFLGNFDRAYCTNTRLMGVISLVVYFDNKMHIYLLDFEEYGIDTFYQLDLEAKEDIRNKILKTSGGLGGNFVNLKEPEVYYLLKKAFEKDRSAINAFEILSQFSQRFIAYENELNQKDIDQLYKKISTAIENDHELINYFLMRMTGNDVDGSRLLTADTFQLNITDQPYTLLKNTIHQQSEGDYLNESIIDFKNKYMLIKSNLKVKNKRIVDGKIIDRLELSPIEASFNLNRKEYILVYNYQYDFYEKFYNHKFMRNSYDEGDLITVFNDNNAHVKDKVYYLNSDIYAVYYFLDNNQLVIASFNQENINAIKDEFDGEDMLRLNSEFELDKSLLYTFVNSGYNDFYDFLEEN